MSATDIQRARKQSTSLTVAQGGTTTGAFGGEKWAGYGLIMPAALTSTAMTFTVCDSADGTYVALYDTTNTQVAMTVAASRAYDLPSELYAWPFWKIVLGTAEDAARTLKVVAKG